MNIEQVSYFTNAVSFGTVIVLWFIFAGTFVLRKKPEASPEATRAPRSWFGFVLQGLSFGLIWALRRTPLLSPLIDESYILNLVLQILAVALAAGSVWLATGAIRELGRQWSLQARLIEGHKLVTGGVYQIVRHPIYTAMLGMLVATGIVYSHWLVLLVATLVFIVGTRIRTASEERLLRDAFGQEYDDFAAKVPPLIPFVKI
jgi:protein-S-isoprenylcysteine O-methyltransferase Ste14